MRALTYHDTRDVRVDNVPERLERAQAHGAHGQANVRRWIDDILPLVCGDDDPLGVEDFATHHVALDDAPEAYETFQKKQDGALKVLLQP